MEKKIIYIKQDEEITSVIDKLVRTKEREVFLVIPKFAVITQSLVNLKLLKREADNLSKAVTIVSQDETVQRLAKKTDFLVNDSLTEDAMRPRSGAEENKEEEILRDQITDNEFEEFLREEKKPGRAQMTDIIRSGSVPIGRLVTKKIKTAGLEEKKELPKAATGEPEVWLPEKEKKEDLLPAGPAATINKTVPIHFENAAPARKIDEEFSEQIKHSYPLEEGAWRKKEPYFEQKKEELAPSGSFIPSFSIRIFGIFVASALIIAGLVFYLVLPKADIELTAKKEKAIADLQIFGDKTVTQADAVTNKIPIRPVKLEDKGSGDFTTTGEKQLNEKARGVISVFNAYSSSPQTLVETTRFLSLDGKIFRLTKTVTIPGAKIEEGKIVPSFLDVDVEADQPGVEYNIGPSDFSIPGLKGSPKYTAFYGKSKKAMTGGSTEKVRVLTQDDFDKAKESIWESMRSKIKEELMSQIPSEYRLLDEALESEISEAKSSVEIGQKADSFSLTIKAVAKGLVFSENDILQLARSKLSNQIPEKKDLIDGIIIDYSQIMADADKGQMTFKARASQEIIWQIDVEEIKKLVAGKQEGEVRQIISQRPEIKEAKFSLWPFWIKTIPRQTDKIHISVD